MLNEYVARQRVADWRRLAADHQLVSASRPDKRRHLHRWWAVRRWHRADAGLPVQA